MINTMDYDGVRAIDYYKILDIAGQSGTSTVYRAMDSRDGRTVAIKLMHEHLGNKPEYQERFLGEGRAVAALDHPSIIRIYEVDLRQGHLFMAMEYIDGGTLRQYLNAQLARNELMDLREIVTITRQVAQALHHAHERGIIHRDVKPDNILLKRGIAGELSAILTDFGIAKRLDEIGKIPATTDGELLGTLAYMAPEQLRGDPIDGRYDVYSLGVMLYELVTGQQPFQSKSAFELMIMHTQGEPERAQDLRPDTPPALLSIIYRAMLKVPRERYRSAAEVARELEALEKSIRPLGRMVATPIRPIVPSHNSTDTIYEVLPALDPPVIPLDLFTEGADDMIIITPPTGAPWSIPLEKPSFSAGRDSNCDICLEDQRVSRRHLSIDRLPDGRITFLDQGSVNGVFLGESKIEKNMVAVWGDSQSLKVGPFWLTLRLARTPVARERRIIAMNAPASFETTTIDGKALLRITPTEAVVEPGSATTIRVEIFNNSDVEEQHYLCQIQGITPDWFTIAPFPLHVPPGKRTERSITFHPPRLPTSAAMKYEYSLQVTPKGQPRQITSLTGSLQIFPYFDFISDVTGGEKGARITNTNRGNSQRFYVIELRDRSNMLLIMPARTRTLIMPAGTAEVEVRIQPKRRTWVGVTRRYPVEVFIRTDGIRPQNLSFDFWAKPVIAWWSYVVVLIILISFVLFLLLNLRS